MCRTSDYAPVEIRLDKFGLNVVWVGRFQRRRVGLGVDRRTGRKVEKFRNIAKP